MPTCFNPRLLKSDLIGSLITCIEKSLYMSDSATQTLIKHEIAHTLSTTDHNCEPARVTGFTLVKLGTSANTFAVPGLCIAACKDSWLSHSRVAMIRY